MAKKFWQQERSLDASRDPLVSKKIAMGRARGVSEAEAQTIGDPNGGLYIETDFRPVAGLAVSVLETSQRMKLSAREGEAVGLYLYGERLTTVKGLYELRDYDGILWALMAEHPPWAPAAWSTISRLMRPTSKGAAVSVDNVRLYVRRAAKKLDVSVPDLRWLALRGLERRRNEEALSRGRAERIGLDLRTEFEALKTAGLRERWIVRLSVSELKEFLLAS